MFQGTMDLQFLSWQRFFKKQIETLAHSSRQISPNEFLDSRYFVKCSPGIEVQTLVVPILGWGPSTSCQLWVSSTSSPPTPASRFRLVLPAVVVTIGRMDPWLPLPPSRPISSISTAGDRLWSAGVWLSNKSSDACGKIEIHLKVQYSDKIQLLVKVVYLIHVILVHNPWFLAEKNQSHS